MNAKDTTVRACDHCTADQTPLGKGLLPVANSRGHGIGLFCEGCAQEAQQVVDEVAALHGAYIVDGRYMCSPLGTPDLRSVPAMRGYIAERRGGCSTETVPA